MNIILVNISSESYLYFYNMMFNLFMEERVHRGGPPQVAWSPRLEKPRQVRRRP